jgi:dihydroneopterin aldolase
MTVADVPAGMTGRIEIRDLRALGVHGVQPFERAQRQPFSVDVDAWLDVAAASASDALADTVDYGALATLVANVVHETSFSLLEALAAEIARRIVDAHPRIERVGVTLRKVRPPVELDVGSLGVHVVRDRRP